MMASLRKKAHRAADVRTDDGSGSVDGLAAETDADDASVTADGPSDDSTDEVMSN